MRNALLLLLSMMALLTLPAQGQERKLIDRLLQPDMEMKNAAQDKYFVADRAVVKKKAPVKSFYVEGNVSIKRDSVTRRFSVMQFFARHFHGAARTAPIRSDIVLVRRAEIDPETSPFEIQAASDGEKSIAGFAYKGDRPFLAQGKSQKALRQHNRPLTIEQVRELLNKNK
jgi:hypothetical protein